MIFEIVAVWVGIPLGILLWKIILVPKININYNENIIKNKDSKREQ